MIETVSGQSYPDFIREHILERAGLTATTFDRPDYTAPGFSPGFRSGLFGGLRSSEVVDTRFKLSASGLISTVSDLVRFANAVFEEELLSSDLVDEMFRPHPDGSGQADFFDFTLGWVARGESGHGFVVDNNGSMEGTTALIELIPARRYALALLANRERYVPELYPILDEARRLIFDPFRGE